MIKWDTQMWDPLYGKKYEMPKKACGRQTDFWKCYPCESNGNLIQFFLNLIVFEYLESISGKLIKTPIEFRT